MKKNEKLLDTIGLIDERHLPDPQEVFNINENDSGQEAEIRLSGAYKRRFPVKAAVLAASAIAAAAFAIVSKKFPLPADNPVDPAYTLNTAIESAVTQPLDKDESFPLDLIGYYIDEEGQYTVNYYDWKKSDNFDLFRKYFFGSWDNAGSIFGKVGKEDTLLVIDDSEKSFIMNDANWRFTGFYELGENVLALVVNSNAETLFFWLDINSPDIMYADMGNGSRLFFYGEPKDYKPTVLTKTDAPANLPEENFLSIYKLYEISRDYGIDFNMLVDIEYYANIYIGNDPYFITENGWLWAKLLHDDWYQFYPVYLVSEAPDKLEFKTRIGNIMYDSSELDAEYTVEKNGAEWKRTVRVTLRDGSVITLNDNDTELSEESRLSPLDLIGYYVDEEGKHRIDYFDWQKSDDFELFREYFFGIWDNADKIFGEEFPLLVIDDSEKSFLANNRLSWRFTGFYKPAENVLAFTLNSIHETVILWLDTNDPETVYADSVRGDYLLCYNKDFGNSQPKVITKTDAPPNEPEENFLSVFRLYEMSVEYGVDFNMLTYIEYENDKMNAALSHDDWRLFYPVYLISEAPDRLEFKTLLGSTIYENIHLDVKYTLEKIGGEWTRTEEITLRDGSIDTLTDNVPSYESDLAALELLDYYIDLGGYYRAGVDKWKASQDYDLFRKYFFGVWEQEYSYGDGIPKERLIIDDSEQSAEAANHDIWFTGKFYETENNVLVFIEGGVAGPTICWIDMDKPDTLYYAGGGIGDHSWIYSQNDVLPPKAAELTKTDEQPNEPANGFLSIYRIYEMSRDYGIGIEMLTEIEYSEKIGFAHDQYANFYPMYLVSETPDKIVLKTILWNYYYEPEEAIDAECTFEKIGGEWKRTAELTLNDGSVVTV